MVKLKATPGIRFDIKVGGAAGMLSERDPTVPQWVKERKSPEFGWDEIMDKPGDIGNIEMEQLINNMGGL